MLIYAAKRFTSTIPGSTTRAITCERCSQKYFYELARVGVGFGSAPYFIGQASAAKRAQKAAQKDLHKRLNMDQEAVPCPACGWIQDAMVRSIRQQKYRGILKLVWYGVPAALLILFIAGLSIYFDRYAKPGQLTPIIQLAALTVASGVAILAFRSFLLTRIDPNLAYPDRPEIAPGTPPALLTETESGVQRLAPATVKPVARDEDWAEVQFQRCELPPVCCECLGPAERSFQTPLADHDNLPVPMCRRCHRKMVWRWWRWVGVSILIACAAGALLAISVRRADTFGRWALFTLVGVLGSVFLLAALPRTIVKPYKLKMVDSDRGVLRLRFRNRQYTQLLIEGYRRRASEQFPQTSGDLSPELRSPP